MTGLTQDIRSAIRALVRSPGFAAVAVLTLALGIGATTAIFSFANALLLRDLPVEAPEKLVWISGRDSLSYRYYEILRDDLSAFSGVAATAYASTGLTVADSTEQVQLALASGEYFHVLGLRPALGRLLEPRDDSVDAPRVAVLRHSFWQARFGGDPGVIGRPILLAGQPFTVVGVAAPGFEGLNTGSPDQLWAPMSHYDVLKPGGFPWRSPNATWLQMFGRIAPGVSPEQAQANASLLHSRYLEETGWKDRESAIQLDPVRPMPPYAVEQYGRRLEMLAVAVGLLLLIACANLANLLLARGVGRRREMAVRTAAGASRRTLIRQLLVEAGALGLFGAAAGLFLSWTASSAVIKLLIGEQAAFDLTPDPTVLGFATAVSLATVFAGALVPAWSVSRVEVAPALVGAGVVGQGPRSTATRGWFVAAQLALCVPMLAGAGLLLRSIDNLLHQDVGFEREQRVQAYLDPGGAGHDRQSSVRLLDELLDSLRKQPGLESVAFASSGALAQSSSNRRVSSGDFDSEPVRIAYVDVSEGYFDTLGIPILAGRDLNDADRPPSPVAVVVNQSLATALFGEQSPVGRTIRWDDKNVFEIVGLVGDALHNDIREGPRPVAYLPFRQALPLKTRIYIRTAMEAGAAGAIVREQVRRLDPHLAVSGVQTLDSQIEDRIRQDRVVSALVTGFGVLALVLTAVGLYGVLAFEVSRRAREVGLRMALGAQQRQIFGLVFRQAAPWVFGGAAAGLALAIAATRLLESFLFQLSPLDPWTFAAAMLVLLTAAALAGLLPARRAARVDPMTALRHD